jgi:hypothetical protein
MGGGKEWLTMLGQPVGVSHASTARRCSPVRHRHMLTMNSGNDPARTSRRGLFRLIKKTERMGYRFLRLFHRIPQVI